MIVVADTSAVYAAFDAAQAEHAAAAEIMERNDLVISPLVLTELDHLTQRDLGWAGSMAIQEALNDRITAGIYRLAELRPADLVSSYEIRGKYEGLHLDLADAVGVIIADRYETDVIFTLDQRDFRAITPLTRRFTSFRILPGDAS